MGSAGSETDARSVCRVSVFMNPFPFRGSDSPWHPRPMEDGVSVHAHCRGHHSLMPWHDSEEGASLLPRCPPPWVPRGKMPSSLMQGGRWRGKLPADSLFWQNHSDGWGKSNPLLFPKVTLFCLGGGCACDSVGRAAGVGSLMFSEGLCCGLGSALGHLLCPSSPRPR